MTSIARAETPPTRVDLPPAGAPSTGGDIMGKWMRALKRRAPLIAAIIAAVTLTALALTLAQVKHYQASATLQISDQNAGLGEGSSGDVLDAERRVNNVVELLGLDTVAREVRTRLRLTDSPREIQEKVTTEATPSSDLVSLTVEDTSPRRAAGIANAYADVFLAQRRTAARAATADAAQLQRRRLEALTPEQRASDEGQVLSTRVSELESAAEIQQGGVEIVRRAVAPDDPSGPRPLLNTGLGLIAGTLLALGVVALLEGVNRRLDEEEDFETAFGLPVLGAVPKPTRNAGPFGGREQREGYGAVAANLRFSSRYSNLRMSSKYSNVGAIMVTSAAAGDGKTATTLGLAEALVELGSRVIVIEADVRRPSISQQLGLEARHDLGSVLRGEVSLSDALVPAEARVGATAVGGDGHRLDLRSLTILPVGGEQVTPQQLLVSQAMPDLIAEARGLADVVLVDTAPPLLAQETLTLVPAVDSVVLVGRRNRTTREQARRIMRSLEPFMVPISGVVMTNAVRREIY